MLQGMLNIVENLGLPYESIILIIIVAGSIIWFATDVKVGAIINFFLTAVFFVMMYESGYNWVPFLVLSLIFLVISVLFLLPTLKTAKEGGFV